MREVAVFRSKVTRFVNALAKNYPNYRIWEDLWLCIRIFEFMRANPDRIDKLKKRFTFGSLYWESAKAFGWHSLGQVQAEALPLMLHGWGYRVEFLYFWKEEALWTERGFAMAVRLPLIRFSDRWLVTFPSEADDFWQQWGYARAQEVPYHWLEGFLTVTKLKEVGFSPAWKWWPGCQGWYAGKQWVEDSDWRD